MISSHLTIENADKVAKMLSSSICEHYFAILEKYTEGKRVNLGKMGNWVVLQYFITGMRSNISYYKILRVKLDACNSQIRNEKNLKLN